MKANYHLSIYKRRRPISAAVPSLGGFVAWPDDRRICEEQKALNKLLNRRRARRGFVAWPEEETERVKS